MPSSRRPRWARTARASPRSRSSPASFVGSVFERGRHDDPIADPLLAGVLRGILAVASGEGLDVGDGRVPVVERLRPTLHADPMVGPLALRDGDRDPGVAVEILGPATPAAAVDQEAVALEAVPDDRLVGRS